MFWMLNLIGLAAIGSNLAAGDGATRTEPSSDAGLREPGKLIREGSRIETKLMVVRSIGESLILETEEDKQAFEALENLALERILQAVRADSGDKRWMVTGQATEYRGRNYILLERVSRAPRATQ
jgi:hypothetical protein